MRRVLDDLRNRIQKKSKDASYLRQSDARSLAAALVDTVMWGNYERVMDTLQVGGAASLDLGAASRNRACLPPLIQVRLILR